MNINGSHRVRLLSQYPVRSRNRGVAYIYRRYFIYQLNVNSRRPGANRQAAGEANHPYKRPPRTFSFLVFPDSISQILIPDWKLPTRGHFGTLATASCETAHREVYFLEQSSHTQCDHNTWVQVPKADVWACDTEEVRYQMVSQLDGEKNIMRVSRE